MCNTLLDKQNAVHGLDQLDRSTLMEVGNILCGSFLTVLSNTMRVKIVEHAPSFSLDMFGAVVDVLIAEMVLMPTEALVIQMRFAFEHARVAGPVLFILGIQDLQTVLEAVDTIKRGA
jgi:chemotaxis protein CheC